MEICEQGHDPIVWVRARRGDDCPLCTVKKELEEAKEKITDLENQIENLESQ